MNKTIFIALALTSLILGTQAAYVNICADTNCNACLTNAAAACTACKTGYYLDPTAKTCTSCNGANPAGCTTCTSATVCGTAAAGYFLNTATPVQAVACNTPVAGCSSCTSTTVCGTAAAGYFLNSATPVQAVACNTPVAGCSSCTSLTVCGTAAAGYFLNSATPVQAVACNTPVAGCSSCTSLTVCGTAAAGYFLNSATPVQAVACNTPVAGCSSCTSLTACGTAAAGYFLNSATPVQAVQCGDTFNANTCSAADTATACSKGTLGSGICCGAQNCGTCATSTVAGSTGANVVCATCSNSYTLFSGTCNCIANCLTCTSATACTTCMSGYTATGTSPAITACVSTTPVPSTDSPATSAFNVTPTSVFASTETTAPAFSGVTAATYGPGFDSSTEYVWAFVVPTTTGTVSVNRRAINGTYGGSLAKLNSSDTAITTVIPYNAGLKSAVGPGYLLIASYVAPTNWNGVGGTATAGDVSITYIPVNGTATTKSVAGNTNVNAYFAINAVWYDTGVAYVIYTMSTHTPGTAPAGGTATADMWAYTGIYINGISVSTGATIYNGTTGGIKAVTLTASSTGTVTGLSCSPSCLNYPPSGVVSDFQVGGTNITNSSTVNYLWTDTSGTYKVIKTGTITLATGAGTAGTALATEAAATGAASPSAASSGTPYVLTMYSAGGFLGSSATSGVFINKQVQSYTATGTSTSVYTTMGYINGTATASNVTAAVVTGYSSPTITGYGTSDGFVLIERQVNTASTGMTYLVQAERFFTNGSTNGVAVNLGTYNDAPLTHQDGNGSIYLGYTLTNTLSPYGTYSGMLGKYLAQSLASGASTLTSIFAFLSLMIVALFAF